MRTPSPANTNPASPSRLTLADAKAQAREVGYSLNHRDGEYRVNRIGGDEAGAYYTNDRQDAVDTARAMAARVAAGV